MIGPTHFGGTPFGRSAAELSIGQKLKQISWGLVLLLIMIASVGLAMLYSAANGNIDMALVFAVLVWLVLVSLVLVGAIDAIERLVIPWNRNVRRRTLIQT